MGWNLGLNLGFGGVLGEFGKFWGDFRVNLVDFGVIQVEFGAVLGLSLKFLRCLEGIRGDLGEISGESGGFGHFPSEYGGDLGGIWG